MKKDTQKRGKRSYKKTNRKSKIKRMLSTKMNITQNESKKTINSIENVKISRNMIKNIKKRYQHN